MTNFKRELSAIGFQGGADEFYATMQLVFSTEYPGWTDEQLKRKPKEAIRFCDRVRAHCKLPDLADELILGGLENARKKSARSRQPSPN